MPRVSNSLMRWAGLVLAFVVGLGVVVLAIFFLAAAIVAGAILAGIVLLRLWWIRRRLKADAEAGVITAEYTVVERERIGADPGDGDERR